MNNIMQVLGVYVKGTCIASAGVAYEKPQQYAFWA